MIEDESTGEAAIRRGTGGHRTPKMKRPGEIPQAFSLLSQRGGRDLKAEKHTAFRYIEAQQGDFTTADPVENGIGRQEDKIDCSSVVNAILPSVGALDSTAKALLLVVARWSASADVHELRRALSRVLAEIA